MATISQADANIIDEMATDGDTDQSAVDRLRTRLNDRMLFKDGTNAASSESFALTDDDSAASNGVLVAAILGPGSLMQFYSANAGAASVAVAATGDTDKIPMVYNPDPVTNLGAISVYVDEDAAGASKLVWNSPLAATGYIATTDGRLLPVAHDASAATNGVQLYFDDDGATDSQFLFISPTNTAAAQTTSTTLAMFVGVGGADA